MAIYSELVDVPGCLTDLLRPGGDENRACRRAAAALPLGGDGSSGGTPCGPAALAGQKPSGVNVHITCGWVKLGDREGCRSRTCVTGSSSVPADAHASGAARHVGSEESPVPLAVSQEREKEFSVYPREP